MYNTAKKGKIHWDSTSCLHPRGIWRSPRTHLSSNGANHGSCGADSPWPM